MLLQVTVTKNVWFVTTGFLIKGSNFKITFVMVAMVWQCCDWSDIEYKRYYC